MLMYMSTYTASALDSSLIRDDLRRGVDIMPGQHWQHIDVHGVLVRGHERFMSITCVPDHTVTSLLER